VAQATEENGGAVSDETAIEAVHRTTWQKASQLGRFPAKAGIHFAASRASEQWTPAFAGERWKKHCMEVNPNRGAAPPDGLFPERSGSY
jgi:hypothetical protein